MINRRTFLTTTTGAAASLMLLNLPSDAAPEPKKLARIGYISGIIGKELETDWQTTLKQTVGYGFTEIEIGKYLGDSATYFLEYCKEIGITPVAGGINITANEELLKQKLDLLAEIKLKYAVVYWPWQVGGPFSLEDCKHSAEILNNMGKTCQNFGMKLCWHNHNKEFIAMEEGLPFDYLMEHTDNDLVKCEMDIYWVVKGGADPLSLLNKYKDRFAILHVKDMAPGESKDFECPGSGIIDFAPIFREAAKQGVKHFFVERDNATDGMACLKSSAEYLKKLTF